MTFAISGTKPAALGGGMRMLELTYYDTEEEARAEAENWLQKGYEDVAVWKQIGVPKLETKVSWEGADAQ